MAKQQDLSSEFFNHLASAIAVLVRAGMPKYSTEVLMIPGSFNIKASCQYICIGETKFRELVDLGEIPKPFPLGGRPHWLREDLDKYLLRQSRNRG